MSRKNNDGAILATLLQADSGVVQIGGYDLHRLDRKVGRRRIRELLERFEVTDAAMKPAATYSGGIRLKRDLAMRQVGNPRLVLLDDPTTGLDPHSRHTMWQIIRDLVASGVTVFLTTQRTEARDHSSRR